MPTKEQLRRAALKLLREHIRLKKGERVVLLTDRRNDPVYAALLRASADLGATIREQRIRSGRQHSAPIPEAREALLWADVVLAPVDASITHSPETILAEKKGLRGISMPGIYHGLFVKSLQADGEKIRRAGKKLMRALKGAREVKITSPSGSDFTLSIKGRKATEFGTDLSKKGTVYNVPFGEVFVAPLETEAQGRIVYDSVNVVRKGALTVKDGRIVAWDKGAKHYVDYLKKAGPCGLVIAELGLGTNPAFKKPIGNVLQDEKILGSVHVAFGQNVSMGGKNKCGVHEDAIIMRPTVRVDGRLVLAEGKMI